MEIGSFYRLNNLQEKNSLLGDIKMNNRARHIAIMIIVAAICWQSMSGLASLQTEQPPAEKPKVIDCGQLKAKKRAQRELAEKTVDSYRIKASAGEFFYIE